MWWWWVVDDHFRFVGLLCCCHVGLWYMYLYHQAKPFSFIKFYFPPSSGMTLVIFHMPMPLALVLVLLFLDFCQGCTDPVWCNVPMPKQSHFRFMSPPTDAKRWRLAQQVAASGRQIFTERAVKSFPHPDNFLGNISKFYITTASKICFWAQLFLITL